MIIRNKPGIFLIVDYNTMRFFVGYSSGNMVDIVRKNFWEIENMTHNSQELNLALHYCHELDYLAAIEFKKGTSRKHIINKRNQIITALESYNPNFGFNTYSSRPSNVQYGVAGIYVIIVYHPKSKKRKFYVGKALNVLKRLKRHEYFLKNRIHEINELQEDYNSNYRFRYQPLLTFSHKEITNEQLKDLETQFIYIFRSHLKEHGYNTNASGVFTHSKRMF